MTVLLDTGFIIATFNRRDHYNRWGGKAHEKNPGGHLCHAYIIDEVLSTAAARLGKEASLKLGNLLVERTTFRILPVTLDIFHWAWPLYRETSQG